MNETAVFKLDTLKLNEIRFGAPYGSYLGCDIHQLFLDTLSPFIKGFSVNSEAYEGRKILVISIEFYNNPLSDNYKKDFLSNFKAKFGDILL